MKSIKYILICIPIILLCSCKKEIDYALVVNTLRHGEWQVSYFEQDGTIGTDQFNGYVFVFNEDGSVTATHESQVTSGTWLVSNGNQSTQLTLNFEPIGPLPQLNTDWHVEEISGSTVRMKHVNGDSDFLTLTKN